MNELKNQIESILFVSNKPVSTKVLAKTLEKTPEEIIKAAQELMETRKNSGVVLLEANGEYQLATNSSNSTQVKNFLNSDLREKLTDATIETLAIIAYRQPISKAEIEAIRGVNSQYSIRILLMRGMIEKVNNPNDARGHNYQITTEFLQHLGLRSVNDLPNFENLVKEVKLPEVPQTAPEHNQENTSVEAQDEDEAKNETLALVEETSSEEIPQTSPSGEALELGDEMENKSEINENSTDEFEDDEYEDDDDEED